MAQFVAEDAGVEVGLIPEYGPKVFAAFFDIVVDFGRQSEPLKPFLKPFRYRHVAVAVAYERIEAVGLILFFHLTELFFCHSSKARLSRAFSSGVTFTRYNPIPRRSVSKI